MYGKSLGSPIKPHKCNCQYRICPRVSPMLYYHRPMGSRVVIVQHDGVLLNEKQNNWLQHFIDVSKQLITLWNTQTSSNLNLPHASFEHYKTLNARRLTDTISLRKHAYSNILKTLPSKNENFQKKNSDIFHISAQNIDCGYTLEPPRRLGEAVLTSTHNLCFWAEIRKIMYTPVDPSFTI